MRSLHALNPKINNTDLIVEMADLIICEMTVPWRFFHTPEHIFEVGDTDDPMEVIAALFHDLVYIQVDAGIQLNISVHVSPFVRERGSVLQILNEAKLRAIGALPPQGEAIDAKP